MQDVVKKDKGFFDHAKMLDRPIDFLHFELTKTKAYEIINKLIRFVLEQMIFSNMIDGKLTENNKNLKRVRNPK